MKMRPKIAVNDYETKKGHVLRFLKGQDRVKITIMFRGREMTHPERGEQLLMRLADDVSEYGAIEQRPSQDGRNMTMVLAPTKAHPEEDAAPADGGEERRVRRPRRQQRIEAAEAADGTSEEKPAEAPEDEAPDAAA
jgi:translation initiation factor IF-3